MGAGLPLHIASPRTSYPAAHVAANRTLVGTQPDTAESAARDGLKSALQRAAIYAALYEVR
jgi:hypothetical protein